MASITHLKSSKLLKHVIMSPWFLSNPHITKCFPTLSVGASVENAVCLDLLVACLKQQMVEDVYPAKVPNFCLINQKFEFTIKIFSSKCLEVKWVL